MFLSVVPVCLFRAHGCLLRRGQGVIWNIMREPIGIFYYDADELQQDLPPNTRPLQALNDRCLSRHASASPRHCTHHHHHHHHLLLQLLPSLLTQGWHHCTQLIARIHRPVQIVANLHPEGAAAEPTTAEAHAVAVSQLREVKLEVRYK